jgi:hypothetical protein
MPQFEPLPTMTIAHPETGEPMEINQCDYNPAIHNTWTPPVKGKKKKASEELAEIIADPVEAAVDESVS